MARRRPGRFRGGRALRQGLVALVVAILTASVAVPTAQADPVGTITVVPADPTAPSFDGALDGGLLWNSVSGYPGSVVYQSMTGAVTALSASANGFGCGNLVVDASAGGAVWQDVVTGESGFADVGGNTHLPMSLLAATHDGWLAMDFSTHLVYAVNARTGATNTLGIPFPSQALGQRSRLCSRTHAFLAVAGSVWQLERATGTVSQVYAAQPGDSAQLFAAWDASLVYLVSRPSHRELRRQDPGQPVTVLRSSDTLTTPFISAAASASDTFIAWTDLPGPCGAILRQPVGGGAAVAVPGTSACATLVTSASGPLVVGSVVARLSAGGTQPLFALPKSAGGSRPRQSAGRVSWVAADSNRVDTRAVQGSTLGPVSTAVPGAGVAVAASGRRTVAHLNSQGWALSSGGAPADYAARFPMPAFLDIDIPVAMVGHRVALRPALGTGLWVVDLATGAAGLVDNAVGLAEVGPLVLDPEGTTVTTPGTAAPLVTAAEAGIPAGGRFIDLVADGDVLAWRWAAPTAGQMGFGWKNLANKTIHSPALPVHVAVTAVSVYGNDVMAIVGGQSPALRVLDTSTEATVMSDASFNGWDPTIGPVGLTWTAPNGEVRLAPLPDQHRPPRPVGTPVQPNPIFVGDRPWAAEWVFDQPLTSCSLAVRNPQGALVRTLACEPAQMARGEAVVTWDGLDGAGQPVPAGDTYSYSLTAGDADGSTQAGGDAVRVLSLDQFVIAAYEDFLGRTPGPGEVAFQANAIVTGAVTREGFLRSLAMSSEWLSAIVSDMYVQTLGRAPDAAGLATWVGWLQSGRFSAAEAAALFYSSDEFFAGLGGGTAQSWVTTLYQDLLGREPDAAGLAQWVIWSNDPNKGRAWVARQFYGSLESRMVRVQDLYQALLGRDPDAVGWPFWADAIQRMDDVQLAVSLAASEEYYLRSQG